LNLWIFQDWFCYKKFAIRSIFFITWTFWQGYENGWHFLGFIDILICPSIKEVCIEWNFLVYGFLDAMYDAKVLLCSFYDSLFDTGFNVNDLSGIYIYITFTRACIFFHLLEYRRFVYYAIFYSMDFSTGVDVNSSSGVALTYARFHGLFFISSNIEDSPGMKFSWFCGILGTGFIKIEL